MKPYILMAIVAISAVALAFSLATLLAGNPFEIQPSAPSANFDRYIRPWEVGMVVAGTDGRIELITPEPELLSKNPGVSKLITDLATNGIICQVLGHQWQPYTGMLVHFPEHPIPVYRVCYLCKRTEQQQVQWIGVQLPNTEAEPYKLIGK